MIYNSIGVERKPPLFVTFGLNSHGVLELLSFCSTNIEVLVCLHIN